MENDIADGSGEREQKGWTILAVVLGGCAALTLVAVVVAAALFVPALNRAKQRAYEVRCSNNLRQLALGAIQYADDQRAYPYDASDPSGRKALEGIMQTYVGNREALTCPFDPPGTFSYEGLAVPLSSNTRSSRPLLWDAKPHPDGRRNVAFADATTRTVDEAEFKKLRAAALQPQASPGGR